MRKGARFFLVFMVLFLVPSAVFAQRGGAGGAVEIRVASPLPRNSDWGRTLDRITAEWSRVTGGAVQARVIHDGLEGGEGRMLSSLGTNSIQGALFTSAGLSQIVPEIMNLSVPFHIRDDDELDEVLRLMLPEFEARTAATNFVVLTWSRAGWVNVFSRERVLVPDDLRRMRLATNTEQDNMNSVFRGMGFTLVEIDTMNMGPLIASGQINALYATPAAIAPLGLQRTLGHMLDMPIAPFMGGIVLNRVTWNRISPAHQTAMMNATRRIAAEFDATMPQTVANAVTMMGRDGLSVNTPNAAQLALWHAELERAMPPLLGQAFDRDIYDRIAAVLERVRNGR